MNAQADTVISIVDRSGFTAYGFAKEIYYTGKDWSADKAQAKRMTAEAAANEIAWMRSRNGISIVLYGTESATA